MKKIKKHNTLRLEHISCDLCGADDYVVRYRKPDDWLWNHSYEYPVVECKVCRLVYVNPRPIFNEMNQFYPAGYHDERNDLLHNERYRNQFDYISTLKPERVLDIGCARGDWLNYLHSEWPRAELHGVDAFSEKLNYGNIIFYKKQLHEANLEKSHFDLITSWAVIEHVHTPDAYFSEISKALKPNGKFVFLVTNSESIYGKYAYKEDIPRHLYHFNQKSLSRYAEKHGLILEKISYDERFWDGSGKGVFRIAMSKILGVTWSDMRAQKINTIKKLLLKASSVIDNVVFYLKWEKHLKCSGIIVVTMTRSAK